MTTMTKLVAVNDDWSDYDGVDDDNDDDDDGGNGDGDIYI